MEACDIKQGEVVWVKIKGYPWWPGIKNLRNDTQLVIKFLGEGTHSTMSSSKVLPFEKYYSQFSQTKKKNLLSAIQQARIISKKNSSEKNETNFLKNKRHRKNDLMPHDLNDMINDFIVVKRNLRQDEFENAFNSLTSAVKEVKVNSNGMQGLLRLLRFLTSSRNFKIEVMNTRGYGELKNALTQKILDSLFDINGLFDYVTTENNNFNKKELIDKINDIFDEGNKNKSTCNSENKSLSDLSSESKGDFGSTKEDRDDKNLNISLSSCLSHTNYLSEFFNAIESGEALEKVAEEIINETKEVKVADIHLRKKVILNLYSILKCVAKEKLSEEMIKKLCIAIESKGRFIDSDMCNIYKDYISEVFSRLKTKETIDK